MEKTYGGHTMMRNAERINKIFVLHGDNYFAW